MPVDGWGYLAHAYQTGPTHTATASLTPYYRYDNNGALTETRVSDGQVFTRYNDAACQKAPQSIIDSALKT